VLLIRYESFENLDELKKLSILNAGFRVFAEYGYSKASVEEIVKAANISKGSLFYYFKSKKNFYLYLYEYCGEQLEKLIDSPGPEGKPSYMVYTDFFERLNAIQLLKMQHATDHPHMNNFMKKVIFEDAPSIKENITKINARYTQERAMAFFQGLNYSKFKDGIDPMMIIQLITWCSEGCTNQIMLQDKMKSSAGTKSSPDFNEVVKLFRTYIDLFRNNFYKEEYLA
jgi:AcrR family transcriptional regulator